MSEADVHFEFYRHLQNAADRQPHRQEFSFGGVHHEYGDSIDGVSDIVIVDASGDPIVVIRAKSADDFDRSRVGVDPYTPKMIDQVSEYAGDLEAPYFCTFSGDRLVVFDTYEGAMPLLKRSTKSYEIDSVEAFADTFLDEVARIRAGGAKWDSNDDAFISRVRSIHAKIAPELETALTNHLDDDEEFRDNFLDWTKSQGIEYEDADEDERTDLQSKFAEQAAYLLINKIIFYKLLEDSPAYSNEIKPLTVSPSRIETDLQEHFDTLVDRVGFEAIFEHDEIYSEIPLERVSDRLREFISELDEQNLRQFDSDVIGRIYEGMIPPERRHEMGEYYTPPAICDLITRWSIQNTTDSVLDPACGSGGFLVSAYHQKRDLATEEQGDHERILNEVFGVDINRFPAHLTAINLAIQDLQSYTDHVNIEVNDFFNILPGTQRFQRERASTSGRETDVGVVGGELDKLDAIVANPPYVRGRNIDNGKKDDIRNHLTRVGGADISGRMDLYGYFLTHSTEFLKNGGRLGFITSDRWLDTGYGAELQDFILNNYRVEAVIKLDQQAFDDALVGSSILLLTREDDPKARRENVAKFVRVLGSIDIDGIIDVVEEEIEADRMIREEDFRAVTRQQAVLSEEDKWTTFFRAPPIYYDLFGIEDTVELQERAHLERGLTSGANDFFYRRNEKWEELGLADYTTPLLKASGQVSRIRFTEEDAREWGVLDLHDLIRDALEDAREVYKDVEEESFVKEWLAEEGHDTLVEYICSGEEEEYHDRPTTRTRTVWFDLGDIPSPPMFIPDFTWRVHRVLWSEINAVSDRQFYYIMPNDDVDSELLCAILNSRVVWLMCELRGRWSQGQQMSRSEIKVYEARELPIPDPKGVPDSLADEIVDAFHDLLDREDSLDEDERTIENTMAERDKLDELVLEIIGMEERLGDLKEAIERMIAMREKEGGDQTEVLVSRPSEREIIELEKVDADRERTTLGDF